MKARMDHLWTSCAAVGVFFICVSDLIRKYTGCYREPSDALDALTSSSTLCSCPAGQMLNPSEGKCEKLQIATLQLHVSHICGVKLTFLENFNNPSDDLFKEMASILVSGIQQALDDHSLPLHACIPRRPMLSGSVVMDTVYNCSAGGKECTIEQLGAALHDDNAPVRVDAGSVGRKSCDAGKHACHANATCYLSGYNYHCQCNEGYKDESANNVTGMNCTKIICEKTQIFTLCLADWTIGLIIGGFMLTIALCIGCKCFCGGSGAVVQTKEPEASKKATTEISTVPGSNHVHSHISHPHHTTKSPAGNATSAPPFGEQKMIIPNSLPEEADTSDISFEGEAAPSPQTQNKSKYIAGTFVRKTPNSDNWRKIEQSNN